MSTVARFTPSTMPAEQLERLFVVRHATLDRLMTYVADLGTTPSPHHTLLIGPRGSGKTHLISLVSHRSRRLIEQGAHFQIAWLPEDPWTIVSYRHLLGAVLQALDAESEPHNLDEAENEMRLRASTRENNPILILAENIDHILNNLGDLGQQKLRHLLQTEPNLLLIGTSTRLDRNLSSNSRPFFGFFDTIRLKPFSSEEAKAMLLAVARESGDKELESRLNGNDALARIHIIAHLAGGQPRLWALLGNALSVEQLDHLADLLLNCVDDLIPYYREQLVRLSPQQRLIVAKFAVEDRPLPVKELAWCTGVDQRTAAKTVGDLTDRGWLRPVSTVFADLLDRRRTYYELAEPLARLAFQVKASHGEPLHLIIDFLITWFDADQLRSADDSDYSRAALRKMAQDSIVGFARGLTELPDPREPSLNLLGRVEDALAAISDGDAEPIMLLPSTLRQAIEYRMGASRDLTPIRLLLLNSALKKVEYILLSGLIASWLERADRLDQEVHSPESRLMLARWLIASQRPHEAEAVLARITPDEEQLLDTSVIARAYLMAGNPRKAIQLFERDANSRARTLGPEHPNTLTAQANLAIVYKSIGDYDKAIDLLKQALEISERTLGFDRPSTNTARNNLAIVYTSSGQSKKAIALHQQALEHSENTFSTNTLDIRRKLAFLYRNTGEIEKALTLLEENFIDSQRIFDADSPHVSIARYDLARAYEIAGRFDELISLHKQTLAAEFRVPESSNHNIRILIARNNLARAYESAGRRHEARLLYENNVSEAEHFLDPEHFELETFRDNLTRVTRAT